jgi:hypothetical protein
MTRARHAFSLLQSANPIPSEPDPGRRWTVLKTGLALALLSVGFLLVAPAVGIRIPALDFWSTEKAPPKVVSDFESLAEGAPPGMDPGAIPGETRKVSLADGTILWVAPTKHGGFCTFGTRSGGCDKLGTFPLSISWGASGLTHSRDLRRSGPPPMTAFDVLEGNANARYVDSVEIRFADGEVDRPALTWVSEPIHQGFFIYQVPPKHRRAGHEIESVVGLDPEGQLVVDATRPGVGGLKTVPRDAIVDKREERARISGRLGEAVIWEAPTHYEGRCAWLELPGGVLRLFPCMPKGYAYSLFDVRFVPTADDVLFAGWVADRYASVEIEFADGSRQVITPQAGFLLGELPAKQLVRGHEATTIVGRDAAGKELQPRIAVGEAFSRAPCFAALPDPPCP